MTTPLPQQQTERIETLAIYLGKRDSFICSICKRKQPKSLWFGVHAPRSPLCFGCENLYGTGQYGDTNPDRRIIKQVSALINAIENEARQQKFRKGASYGRA